MAKKLMYVDGELDDLGLDVYEFRILGRIARRGECYESIANIAESCGMSHSTAKRKLADLVAMGLVEKDHRPGRTCIYRIADREEWSIDPGAREAASPRSSETQVSHNPGHQRPTTQGTCDPPPRVRVTHPYKVPPIKGVHLSDSIPDVVAVNKQGVLDLTFLSGGGDGVYLPVVRDLSERYSPETIPQLVRDLWGRVEDPVLAWCRDAYRKHGFERLVAAIAIAKDRAEAGGGRPSIKLAAGVLRRLGPGHNGHALQPRASPITPPPDSQLSTEEVRAIIERSFPTVSLS